MLIRGLTNSIASRMAAVSVVGLVAVQVLAVIFMQFPALHSFFPIVLGKEGKAIAELVWMIEKTPEEIEPYVLSISRGTARHAEVADAFPVNLQELPKLRQQIIGADTDAASRLEERRILFGSRNSRILPRLGDMEDEGGLASVSSFVIAVELDDGRVLVVELAPFLYLSSGNVFLVFAGLFLGLIVLQYAALAVFILKPIQKLEHEAERVGLSDIGGEVAETGPFEMRRIAQALNRMRARLAGLVREREHIVAAIAHDIRTGITKIRLRTDSSGGAASADLESDLNRMEQLVTDMLTYARAESPSRPSEVIDLPKLVANAVEDMPFPIQFIRVGTIASFPIVGDPLGLHRMFENLLENARRYGAPPITVTMEERDGLTVCIRDCGPGLPDDLLEMAFEPFVRGDSSRSTKTGGSGLGLGIARAIARAHGAELQLQNHPDGGLVAVLSFPRELTD